MADVVTKKDYVTVKGAMRCVDERKDKEGELLGVQLPGGALHIADLFQAALLEAGDGYDQDTLYDMVKQVFQSDQAQDHDILPGVHIDDKHGEIKESDELEERVSGCGYDGVRTQVFERLDLDLEYESGDDIERARDLGWNVQVLTGDHAPDATAAINSVVDTTLKTQTLHEDERTLSFNYDWWVVRVLKPVMVEILEEHDFEAAAEELDAHAKEWGRSLYVETLDILSDGRLGDEDLIEIV